jgi:hypothetical protein
MSVKILKLTKEKRKDVITRIDCSRNFVMNVSELNKAVKI